nr:DUF2283 domain-containing protein [Streptomyces sp. GbtcB7]
MHHGLPPAPHPPQEVQQKSPCRAEISNAVINLDFDEQGLLIGIEVLAASSKLPEYLLQSAERLDTEGA